MNYKKHAERTSAKALYRFAATAAVLLAICLVFMMPAAAETYSCSGHTDWTELTSSTTTPLATGKYYLTSDLALSSSLTIAENAQVTLCLNGSTLKAADSVSISIITVSKGAVLNLTDSNENQGKITGGKGTSITTSISEKDIPLGSVGGGIYIQGGTLNMYGGNITGCTASMGGGGVFVYNDVLTLPAQTATVEDSVSTGGIFNMYGGTLTNCNSDDGSGNGNGGAVWAYKSKFTMTGGVIESCSAHTSGGGVFVQDSEFTMFGDAKIQNCKTTDMNSGSGGGVSVSSDTGASFTMDGGEISGCESAGSGGGVNIGGAASASFTMKSGKITDCKTTNSNAGGGVSAATEVEFTMSGGEITGCTAKDNKERGVTTNAELTITGCARVEGVSLGTNSVIIIPADTIFFGSISGITSSTVSGDEEDRELIKVEGSLGENAEITGSSDESSDEEDGGVSLIEFTVTWKNHDGTVLKTNTGVRYGTSTTYDGETPTKASNETHSFTFAGWTPEVAEKVTKNVEYTATFTAVEIPPVPSSPSSSGSSKDTGSGNFQYYPRSVPADGIISFGTSKVVSGMELPVGSDGTVTLNTKPTFEMPENGFYAFEIDAPGYNTEAKINGGLSFKISLRDLEAAGWTAEDIVLFHGTISEDGKITWEALPTNLVANENGVASYKAAINGCSPFYIGFVKDGSIVNTPIVEPTEEPEIPTVPETPDEVLQEIPPMEEPETPAPLIGVLAGLGAAVLLRRK